MIIQGNVMKKIISTQGYTDGHYEAPNLNTAISERVDNRLTACYRQYYGDDIQVTPSLTYRLADGQVTTLELAYTIDDPTSQRLENFREVCDLFYELHSFIIETAESPRVLFRATDLYDMASLIHALDFLSVSLESILCSVDASLTENDAIYSPSGAYILQIPNVPHYSIPEGTLNISPTAARHSSQLQTLDIPADMIFDDNSLAEYPKGLKVRIRDTHYDGMPVEEEEDSDEMPVFDEHGVGYSADGKRLLCCRITFCAPRYEVSDGVEEIDDFAFISCRHYLELSIPRSVHTIGDNLFGNGGVIKVREES